MVGEKKGHTEQLRISSYSSNLSWFFTRISTFVKDMKNVLKWSNKDIHTERKKKSTFKECFNVFF